MIDEKAQFRAALAAVRSGSSEAVWRFITDYGPHLQRIVRRQMDRRMQSKYDSVDFVQMVWASFFRNPGDIQSFGHPEDLLRYLTGMARNKYLSERRRRVTSRKYDVTRECSLSEVDVAENTGERQATTPSQLAIAREEYERMMERLSHRDQEIVRMRLNRASYVEISRHVGVHERTARHVVKRAVRLWRIDSGQ